jgi:hypothetical protein
MLTTALLLANTWYADSIERTAPMRVCLASLLAVLFVRSASAQEVRDSAGVRVVTVPVPRTTNKTWKVSPSPILQIRSSEDGNGPLFSRAYEARRLMNGSILFIPQAASAKTIEGYDAEAPRDRIAVFDAQGRFLRFIGRKGRGPGEFQNITAILPYGADSLLVWDYGIGVSQILLDGKFVRRSPIATSRHVSFVKGPFRDHSFVVQTTDPGAGEAHFVRIDKDGKPLNDIVGPVFSAVVGPTPVWSPYGQRAVCGDYLFYSEGATYEIRAFTNLGKLEQIIRIDRPLRRTTEADIRAYEHATASPSGLPRGQQAKRRYSEYLPAIAALLTDAEGDLWVGEGSPTLNATSWLVIDSNGHFLGAVATPNNMRVTNVGRDYVIGICHDPESGDWVCMYAIQR